MSIFPIFLETHRGLYTKLFCVNFLNINNFDFILLLNYNILNFFNFKIYNIYHFTSNIILVGLLILFIKYGAFKHIYAAFKYSR